MKKKSIWKKALSAFLVLTMLLGSMILTPLTASAADAWDGATVLKPMGAGTYSNPYLISSGAELAYLGTHDSLLFTGETVYFSQVANINMGGHELLPIEAATTAIQWYGNGHTISNYKITSTSDHVGLFYATGHGSAFYDLHIAMAYVKTTAAAKAATLVANADGNLTMVNCSVDANSYVESPCQAGGLVGGEKGSTTGATWSFSYCVNEATLVAGDENNAKQIIGVGGIIGRINTAYVDNISLDYCANRGNITVQSTSLEASGNSAGGLIGATLAVSPYKASVTVSNGYNSGNITANIPAGYNSDNKLTGTANIGGIYGRIHIGHTAVLQNVYDVGHHDITSLGTNCGLITGWGSGGELTKSFINAYGLLDNATNNPCIKTSATKATVLTDNGSYSASKSVHAINTKPFGDMYNSDAVESVDSTIYLCKKSGSSYVYDRTSTIADEIAAIDAAIEAKALTTLAGTVPAGEGTASTPWVISNAAQMTALSTILSSTVTEDNYVTEGLGGVEVPAGYTGTATDPENVTPASDTTARTEFYIEFAADVNMNGAELTPLGGSNLYTYHINGNGHTLSNFKITSTSDHVGLIKFAGDGTEIRNLHIAGATISTTASKKAAAFVANADGDLTLYHCSTDASTKIISHYVAGGLLGGEYGSLQAATWDIRYCINRATITAGSATSTTQLVGIGGIVGVMNTKYVDSLTMQYCANAGNITATTTAVPDAGNFVGGLIGATTACSHTLGGYRASLTVSNCYNSGVMTVNAKAGVIGGIVGRIHIGKIAVLENVYDAAVHSITTSGSECGIITGWGSEDELYKSYINAYGLVNAAHTTNETKATILTQTGSKTATHSVHPIPVNTVNTFVNMYNSDGVTSITAPIDLCKKTESGYVYDRTTTVAAEVARIASTIENLPSLDISSGSGNLMVRLKLTDPFGFMAITSMSVKGSTLKYADYDFDSYGFMFLDSKAPVTVDELLANEKTVKVSGKRYTGNYFYGVYDKITASSLDKDLYFLAYAEIDGQIVTSGVRMLNPYDMAKDASDGSIGLVRVTNPYEVLLYQSMLEYNQAYDTYNGGTVLDLKVSTYNIWACLDNTSGLGQVASNCHPSFVSDYMLANDIDIIGMQEVDVGCSRSNGYNEPAEIAKNMANAKGVPYYWAFASGLTDYRPKASGWDHSYYGNALVSKYPILSYRAVQSCLYPDTKVSNNDNEYEQRSVLVADLDVDGQIVTVIVTHLDLRAPARQHGIERVLETIGQKDNPVILMGDMNDSLNSFVEKQFCNLLTSCYEGMTINASNSFGTMPGRVDPIDYIYYSDGLVQKGAPVLHDEVVTSDHYPVSVTIGLEKRAQNTK